MQRDAVRIFKVTRMQHIVLTDTPFSPEQYDAAHDESAAFAANTDAPLTMRFGADAAYRLYDTFLPEQIEKLPDGGFLVRAAFPRDGWVYGFLLSFGSTLLDVQPQQVKRELARRMRAALTQWEGEGENA